MTERVRILLEPAEHNWAASSPDVPGLVAVGDSAEDALCQFWGALAFHREGDSGEVQSLYSWEKAHPHATTYDIVRRHFPNATDAECEALLWEETPYPRGFVQMWDDSLARAKARSNVRT